MANHEQFVTTKGDLDFNVDPIEAHLLDSGDTDGWREYKASKLSQRSADPIGRLTDEHPEIADPYSAVEDE